MKITKFYPLLVAILTATVLSSCTKVEGCMDLSADNYNEVADRANNNLCEYTYSLGIWHNESTADHFAGLFSGSNTFYYYINGTYIGNQSAYTYYDAAPSCGNSTIVGSTVVTGSTTAAPTFTYRVEDEDGDLIWSGSVDASAYCTTLLLTN